MTAFWTKLPKWTGRGAAALLLAGTLSACGDNTDTGETQQTGADAAPQEVVLHRGNSGEPSSLDPHRIAGTWESSIARDLYLGLMTDAADATPIYGAAESHTVSEDGLTYTFTMRDGHTWSDGTPVTAQDFVYSWRRILNPETAAEYASLMYVLKNGLGINTQGEPLDTLGARAIDDRTLEVTLEYPAPYFLQLLTHQAAYPVPPHVVEAEGDGWITSEAATTNGAYVIDEWRPNDFVRLKKNERFYDAENVAIDTVIFYPTDDRPAAVRRFRAGELDMNDDFPSQNYERLKELLPGEVLVTEFMLSNCYFINVEQEPFNNPDIRLAMGMAIDRNVLTDDILRTGQTPSYAFVPPSIMNYPHTAQAPFKDQPMEERIAQARAMMEEAGFSEETPLRFTLRYREGVDNRRVAIAIAGMWRQIHINAELLNTEAKTHYNDLRSGNYVVADGGWVADYNDATNYLFLLETDTGFLNYANYSNPDFDRMMKEARNMVDVEARGALLAEAEQLMLNEMPVIPTLIGTRRHLVGAHVKGFVDNPEDKHPTRFLSIDESARRR